MTLRTSTSAAELTPAAVIEPPWVDAAAVIGPDAAATATGHDLRERAVRDFLGVRPKLLAIAYRILRDPAGAEDIVQDAWLRWQAVDHGGVRNAEAFLATTTTRLALNDVQSARQRREVSLGSWLADKPEPGTGPEWGAEHLDELGRAVLVLLARLAPAERAAYVLREAFDYPYDRIAGLLALGPANCRQLVRRARQRIDSGRRRPVSTATHRRFLAAFRAAARAGNVAALERILVADVAAPSDSRVTGASGYDPAA